MTRHAPEFGKNGMRPCAHVHYTCDVDFRPVFSPERVWWQSVPRLAGASERLYRPRFIKVDHCIELV